MPTTQSSISISTITTSAMYVSPSLASGARSAESIAVTDTCVAATTLQISTAEKHPTQSATARETTRDASAMAPATSPTTSIERNSAVGPSACRYVTRSGPNGCGKSNAKQSAD